MRSMPCTVPSPLNKEIRDDVDKLDPASFGWIASVDSNKDTMIGHNVPIAVNSVTIANAR